MSDHCHSLVSTYSKTADRCGVICISSQRCRVTISIYRQYDFVPLVFAFRSLPNRSLGAYVDDKTTYLSLCALQRSRRRVKFSVDMVLSATFLVIFYAGNFSVVGGTALLISCCDQSRLDFTPFTAVTVTLRKWNSNSWKSEALSCVNKH